MRRMRENHRGGALSVKTRIAVSFQSADGPVMELQFTGSNSRVSCVGSTTKDRPPYRTNKTLGTNKEIVKSYATYSIIKLKNWQSSLNWGGGD